MSTTTARPTLADRAAAGYCIDEWERWQQGGCLEYAVALMIARPSLRFGTLTQDNVPVHHIAHDDTHAYDSAGKHPLPYLGIDGDGDLVLCMDEEAEWYDLADEDEVTAALEHIARNDIL